LRLFIGSFVNISDLVEDEVREKIFEFLNYKVSKVKEGNFHITWKFLGEVENACVPKINEVLEQNTSLIKNFQICFNAISLWPDKNKPKILVVEGVDITGQTELFVEWLNRSLCCPGSGFGFEMEKRKFKPHVTLARFKNIERKLKIADTVIESRTVNINKIQLISSEITPDGSNYRIIRNFNLDKI